MSDTFYIEGDSLASLNISRLSRQLNNQGRDRVLIEHPITSAAATPKWSYGETLTIRKGDALWFYGRVVDPPQDGTGSTQSMRYDLVGPWWWLEKITYRQSWKIYQSGALTNKYKSRVILGQDSAGDRMTNGEQVADVIDYAISQGAPMQKGDIDPDIPMLFDERTSMMCSEVIISSLRDSPDAICYFDYTTSPPTFHCRKAANLSSVTVSVAGKPSESYSVRPRYDTRITGVRILYEKKTLISITGDPDQQIVYESVDEDTAGSPDDIEAIEHTEELAGGQQSYLRQSLETAEWPEDLENAPSFWKWIKPTLDENRPSIDNLSIHDVTLTPEPSYDYYIKEGSIQDWMETAAGNPINQESITVEAQVDYDFKAGGDVVDKIRNKPVTFTLIATDAETKTYSRLESIESGESVPSNVAQKLYAAWSPLQYDGRISHVEALPSGSLSINKLLCLSGGQAAWATMNARIQQISEDVLSGKTNVTFGPPKHLGPADLVELMRRKRSRRVSVHFKTRTTGISPDAGDSIDLPSQPYDPERDESEGEREKFVVSDSEYAKKINLDQTLLGANQVMQPRELSICTSSGEKRAMVLMTALYDPPE